MTSAWLLVGITAATSALFLFAGFPDPVAGTLLAIMASLPLFMLGAAKGAFPAGAAGAAAFIALVPSLGFVAALYYALVNAIPAGLLIWQAERSRSEAGRLTLILVGYAAAAVAVAVFYFSSAPGGLEGVVRGHLNEMLSTMMSNPAFTPAVPLSEAEISATVEAMAAFFPAMAAGIWLLLLAANAALAQGVMKRFDRAVLPTPDIAELYLPRWLLIVLAVAIALSYLPGSIGYLGANVTPIVLLAYLFAGLGVVHAMMRRWAFGAFWLATTYFLLILFGWPAVPIAIVGLLDAVFDFRRRAGPSAPPTEDD